MHPIRLKRAYEPASPDDGTRVLVERLWPRGVSRDAAALAFWARDIAPSPSLRRWYGHDSERWVEFRERYLDELRSAQAAGAEGHAVFERLKTAVRQGPVTFVFAARDTEHCSARVLKEFLEQEER